MEQKVLAILKAVLEDENVNMETSRENNPIWDSLRHLNVIVELESEFDICFEPDEIESINSVSDIIQILQNR